MVEKHQNAAWRRRWPLLVLSGLTMMVGACEGIQVAMPQPGNVPPPSQPGPSTPPTTPPTTTTSGGQAPSEPISPGAIGPSLADLDQMAGQLLQHDRTGRPIQGYIVDDARRSGGVAAIAWNGQESVIFVHPERRQTWSYNTWAFIIGHELSHALLEHDASIPRNERQADRRGADMAHRAGYEVAEYIAFMCQRPDVCSPSHGCFHDRMNGLERRFNVRGCGVDPRDHEGHTPATGFPGSVMEEPCGCVRHGESCQHAGPRCTVKAPVQERVQCQHPVQTATGWESAHPDGDLVWVVREVESPVCLKEH